MAADLLAEVARHATLKTLARGEMLWQAGEVATQFIQVVSGLVKICRPSAEGAETIVAVFGPGECIGDAATVQRGRYPANAVALSDEVTVLRIDATPVLREIDRNAALMEAVNAILLQHTQALQQKIRIMTAGAVPHRLATLFLLLAERFGKPRPDGTIQIPLHLSRGDIAALIGATVETTIRALSRWQKEHVLTTTEGSFLLHQPERLKSIVA